jgi:hypothetical protein
MSWVALWGTASALNACAAAYESWVGFAARGRVLPLRLTPGRLRGARAVEYRKYSWQAFGAAGMFSVFFGLFGYLAANNPFETPDSITATTTFVSLALSVAAASVVWIGFCSFMASKTR